MGSKRQTQIAQLITERAADYFARESNYLSLITVTRADISPDLKNVIVFLSILPVSAEQEALEFAKRSRSEFREFLTEKTRLKHVPTIDFEIDYGEKNRQRIDDLTR
jgi:ribosome-binding factor A